MIFENSEEQFHLVLLWKAINLAGVPWLSNWQNLVHGDGAGRLEDLHTTGNFFSNMFCG